MAVIEPIHLVKMEICLAGYFHEDHRLKVPPFSRKLLADIALFYSVAR